MRALLVDDEEELVTTLAERLTFRGIEASWSTSSENAMSLARTETFDIAVLDVKMPRMGGIGLKKRLEEIQPAMKFIFLTGHGSEEDFKIGSAEAAYYLVKPVDIEALIDKMNEALKT